MTICDCKHIAHEIGTAHPTGGRVERVAVFAHEGELVGYCAACVAAEHVPVGATYKGVAS